MKKLVWLIVLTMTAGTLLAEEREKQQRGHGYEHHKNFGLCREEQNPRRRGRGAMFGENMTLYAISSPEVAQKIGLSEEQRKKIETKMRQLEDIYSDLKYKKDKAALKQADLMTAKELDEDALMRVIEETGRYRTQMAKERVKLMIFMRETLTPEQLRAVHGMMRKRMSERRKMCGKSGEREDRRGSWKEREKAGRRNRP